MIAYQARVRSSRFEVWNARAIASGSRPTSPSRLKNACVASMKCWRSFTAYRYCCSAAGSASSHSTTTSARVEAEMKQSRSAFGSTARASWT